ncbi:hypothetical protein DYU05_04390 [Mucilaginibacter terrenus]|uniref:Tetratricopeptide repeat protein n=1 Tax=Mucilaginibacter terrenus TaxID=2482727 RepID=A0A3E2NV24_9SPHI|nr:hypothetical protein [Mucilaginibacter terrenus]RFZ84852.1 hypothetical protein DYU05_04390 [Mucilaginibacter terrenus]
MDTYYTIEEKYLQAVDELAYGETPKALHLLNRIVGDEPMYARAHHLLGKIYYYDLKDYQTAGYHFKTCMELEPSFPDNYIHYLSLVVFLQMDKQVDAVSARALTTPGVDTATVYEQLGLYAEKKKLWSKAKKAYRDGHMEALTKAQRDEFEEAFDRVKQKKKASKALAG